MIFSLNSYKKQTQEAKSQVPGESIMQEQTLSRKGGRFSLRKPNLSWDGKREYQVTTKLHHD